MIQQQFSPPRALPVSRSLASRCVDSRKSAIATPVTRTLLIWGSKGAPDAAEVLLPLVAMPTFTFHFRAHSIVIPRKQVKPLMQVSTGSRVKVSSRHSTFSAPGDMLSKYSRDLGNPSSPNYTTMAHSGFLTHRGSSARTALPPTRGSLGSPVSHVGSMEALSCPNEIARADDVASEASFCLMHMQAVAKYQQ